MNLLTRSRNLCLLWWPYILFALIAISILVMQLPVGIYRLSEDLWNVANFATVIEDPNALAGDLSVSIPFQRGYSPFLPRTLVLLKSLTGSYEVAYYVLHVIIVWLALVGFFRLSMVLSGDLLLSVIGSLIFNLSMTRTSLGDVIAVIPLGNTLSRTVYLVFYMYVLILLIRPNRRLSTYIVGLSLLAALVYVHNLSAVSLGISTFVGFFLVRYKELKRQQQFGRTLLLTGAISTVVTFPYLFSAVASMSQRSSSSGFTSVELVEIFKTHRANALFSPLEGLRTILIDINGFVPGYLILGLAIVSILSILRYRNRTSAIPIVVVGLTFLIIVLYSRETLGFRSEAIILVLVAVLLLGLLAPRANLRFLVLLIAGVIVLTFGLLVLNGIWLNIPALFLLVRNYKFIYFFLLLLLLALFPLVRRMGRQEDLVSWVPSIRVAFTFVLILTLYFPLKESWYRMGFSPPVKTATAGLLLSVNDLNRDAQEVASYISKSTDVKSMLLGPIWLRFKTLRPVAVAHVDLLMSILSSGWKLDQFLELYTLRTEFRDDICERTDRQVEIARRLGVDFVVREKFSYLPLENPRMSWFSADKRAVVEGPTDCVVFENRSFALLRVDR